MDQCLFTRIVPIRDFLNGPGSATRSIRPPRTSRSARCSRRSSSIFASTGRGGHRARGDDPVHARGGGDRCRDYAETDGTSRVRASTHSTLMVVGLVLLLISLVLRAGSPPTARS
jgi:hypothetical protein